MVNLYESGTVGWRVPVSIYILHIRQQLNPFVLKNLKEGMVITIKPSMCKLPIYVSSIPIVYRSILEYIPADSR